MEGGLKVIKSYGWSSGRGRDLWEDLIVNIVRPDTFRIDVLVHLTKDVHVLNGHPMFPVVFCSYPTIELY